MTGRTTLNVGDRNVADALLAGLNDAMLKAAEPIIQKALQDAERAMRERLAAALIARLESNVSFNRMGDDLVIHIRRPA